MKELTIIDSALLKDDPFPVDFDDAWQWVGYSSKQKAKEALERNFTESEDYHLNRKDKVVKRAQGGGTQADRISLTADCFKEFCMMAGTDKGKEVRRYFIQAEKRLRHVIEQTRVSKAVRRELTDSIQYAIAHGHKDMHGFEYKTYTDLIYKAVLGMTAKKYREVMGLDAGAGVKEHLTADQAVRVATLEKLVGSLLESGFDYEQIKEILEKRALPGVRVA